MILKRRLNGVITMRYKIFHNDHEDEEGDADSNFVSALSATASSFKFGWICFDCVSCILFFIFCHIGGSGSILLMVSAGIRSIGADDVASVLCREFDDCGTSIFGLNNSHKI